MNQKPKKLSQKLTALNPRKKGTIITSYLIIPYWEKMLEKAL